MKKEALFNLLFLAIFIVTFYLFYRILSPYLSTLSWAVILTILFFPLYRLVYKLVRERRNLAAAVMTILVIVMIIFPAAGLFNILAKELVDVYAYCEDYVQEGKHLELFESVKKMPKVGELLDRHFDFSKIDLNALLLDNLRKLSMYVAGQTSKFIRRLSTVIFHFFLMSVSIFFLFRDGEMVMEKIKSLMPFSLKERENILRRIVEMIQATIRGGIVVALVQGALGGLGFLVVGLSSPVFWGAAMAFLSFVPVVGAYLVWIPASLILLVQGPWYKGVILLLWGAILISLSDNVLRPILISGRTQIHTLLLFFGILGGLKAFGFVGFIAGPLIITICLAMIDIYTSRPAG